MKIKQKIIATAAICILILLAVSIFTGFWSRKTREAEIKVGFICSEDESTPYTYNFLQAKYALEEHYDGNIQVFVRSNVHGKVVEESIRELIRKGCRIFFVNADTEAVVTLAPEYPEIQFCQISMPEIAREGLPENYHTYNGEIYQARYAAGVVAGIKLRDMIDNGIITPDEAIIGYVAANNSAEVVSGYTAYLMGVRSAAPEAVMRVRYTGSWSNYPKEKAAAKDLINEGCVILSHHTNTSAPAIACEEMFSQGKRVFFVGYHRSMMDVAPSCALVSIRTNWVPYILEATEATMLNQPIEEHVRGNVHGNDISAGFGEDWVQMLELNKLVASPGTEERMNQAIDNLTRGRTKVFQGNYTGVNPDDPSDTIDLSSGFEECRDYSSPAFRYILKDIIIEDN